MKYFGSSGIRGIVNDKITADLGTKVGKALGSEFDRVIIGKDPRHHGQMVESALISGLLSRGCDVWKAGMIPTPTLGYSTKDFDCGIMVTASHNTSEYNGIKLFNPNGRAFDTQQMEMVEELIDSSPKGVSWEDVGRIHGFNDAVESHKQRILDIFGTDHDIKVVIDCANGAGCAITPFLLKEMGCDVVSMNSNPDGRFPAHDPEPVEENLKDLGKMVVKTEADLGLAHDGDADRLVAFDNEGNFLGGDQLLALFASRFKNKVAVPVNSSMVLEEMVDEVIRTKVGDVFVAESMERENAQFGGEPSGTWIFPETSYAPDAIYAAAFLVKLAEEIDLSEKIKNLSSYPGAKEGFVVKDKESVMSELIKEYRDEFEEDRLNFADGIRISYENGWSLIRASGTEPKIRITAEALDEESLNDIFNNAKNKLKEVL
ncbi:MAG: phosphoglucosamine mutase [Candidatus Saliniplasma sp.]